MPKALTALIDDFGSLPGVGARTAERYAYAVLRRNPKSAKQLSQSLDRLHDRVKTCPKTFALIDASKKINQKTFHTFKLCKYLLHSFYFRKR